jgi:hypothetical protein
MATRDQYMQALKAADASGNVADARELARRINTMDSEAATRNEDYSNEGRSRPTPVNPAAEGSFMERYGAGVEGGANSIRANILKALDKANAAVSGNSVFTKSNILPPEVQQQAAADRQRINNQNDFYQQTKDQLGTAGFLGDLTPEVLATAMPIAKAGTAAARIPMVAGALGRYAPAVGDIAANALYSGARRAGGNYVDDKPIMEDVGSDAAMGGAGAAGGRVLMRALGGMKPLASKSAQELIDRGVIPTPGQLFDGPVGNVVRATEDRLAGYPVVGDIINYARKRGLSDYGRAEVNDAIEGLGKTVSGSGKDALERAQAFVSKQYDSALTGMHMPGDVADTFVHAGLDNAATNPLLDDAQQNVLHRYAARLSQVMREGADGQTIKQIDSELGAYGRKFSRSMNPADHSLGEGFYDLQTAWREAIQHVAPEDKVALLEAANKAHRNLLPIVKAVDKAGAQQGVFTPNQLQRSYGPFRQNQTSLNEAAQDVMPGRVPDSGTAGRLLLAGALGGGAAISGPTAGATLVASVLYSRPGMALVLNGLSPLVGPKSMQYLSRLTPDALNQELARMYTKYPHIREGITNSLRQAAAQMGRINAQQPGQPGRGTMPLLTEEDTQ